MIDWRHADTVKGAGDQVRPEPARRPTPRSAPTSCARRASSFTPSAPRSCRCGRRRRRRHGSPAIYRYFPSRDHLLTALIVESYEQLALLAARFEAAAHELPREQFVAVAGEFVAWSLAHPQDFALLYGSPVPDYRAPEDTVAPAAQVAAPSSRRWVGQPAGHRRVVGAHGAGSPTISRVRAREVGAALGLGLPDAVVVGAFLAMGHLVGVVTLHLGGHLVGTFGWPMDSWPPRARRAPTSRGSDEADSLTTLERWRTR